MVADVRTIIADTVEFSNHNREVSLPIDVTRLHDLVDINLQIYSGLTAIPISGADDFTGGEDFRVYINDHDITSPLIEELQLEISSIDHGVLKSAYLKGAEAYIRYIRALQVLPDKQIKEEWSKALAFADDEDWPTKLSKLGDRNVGWTGNLHCLNFIYRFIPLGPISLTSVWHRYSENAGALPENLSDFDHLVFTISEGISPSFGPFDSTTDYLSGRIVYQLELHHKNPLEDDLRQIASRLKAVGQNLEKLRTDYLTPIKSSVDVANQDIELGNTETKHALDRLTTAVKKIG